MTQTPRGWVRTTLGELGRYMNGRGFKKSEWANTGRPIIRIQNLTGSGSSFNYFAGTAEERHVVRRGDLLVSWAATLGVYEWDGPEAVLNQHIFKVESFIDRRFHKYLIERTLNQLLAQAHGTGMVHITRKPFDRTPVLLPPRAEQRRIVEAIEEQFSRLDAAEDSLERALSRVRVARRSAIASLVRRDWVERPVGEVAEIRAGIQKQPSRRPRQNRAPFLRVANVLRGELNLKEVHEIELFEGELERFRLLRGDLLVVEGNGSISQIGRSAVWDGSIPGCVHQNHLIRVRPSEALLPEFLDICWNSPSVAGRISAVASSTSGLYTMSAGKVARVSVPVPPIDEQAQVIQQHALIKSLLDSMEKETRDSVLRARRLRAALLREAFAGRLVRQDPSVAPTPDPLRK